MKAPREPSMVRNVVVATIILLLAAACGASASTVSDASSAGLDVATDAAMDTADVVEDVGGSMPESEPASVRTAADGDAAAGPDLGGGAVAGAQTQPLDLGRDIIFTATVEVAVPDVSVAGAEAGRVMARFGGLLFGQNTTSNPSPRSVLVFKVQPQDFQAALAALGEIGEIRNQSVSADDVTERVVDLESRISTAEASVARLRDFLEGANDLETIATLEAQLLERETRLETLKGQLRTVRDQVDLATITLTLIETLSQPAVGLTITSYAGEDDGLSCPGNFDRSRIDEGGVMVVCYEITNVGDTPLTNLTLRDPVINIDEIGELTVVFGDPTNIMEPGESVTLAHSRTTDRSVRPQTRITAVPVNEAGVAVDGRSVADTQSHFLEAVDPGGIPSFSEGLSASWDLLKDLARVALLLLGALIPFIWVLAVAWFLWRWLRRRRAARLREERESTPPPPRRSEHEPVA